VLTGGFWKHFHTDLIWSDDHLDHVTHVTGCSQQI